MARSLAKAMRWFMGHVAKRNRIDHDGHENRE
jgi:hypothetical protein